MPLFRYILSLGLMLCLSVPAYGQVQRLHPETGEAILASETASLSLLREGIAAGTFQSRSGDDLTLIKHLAAGETRGIAVVGEVLYRSNGGYFEALDVSDPAAPVLLSRILAEQSVVQDVQVVGDLAYVVSARSNFPDGAGLRIVDVSDPANLTVIGEALGQTAFGVAVSGDYAYVGAATAGFSVYDVSDSAAPTRVTTLPVSGASVLKVAVDGTTAYISGGNAGFRTVDITDPESPGVLGSFATTDFATNVAYADGAAYVLSNGFGLTVLDVTDPAMPAQVGTFEIPSSQVRGIQLDGATAFITSQAGLVVLDVTDPAAITEIGSVPFDNTGSGQSVVRVGDTAYVGNRFDGVRVIDVASLAAPEEIALIQNGGFSFKVHVDGDYAYVSDLIGEYRIIDISDPENAEIIGRADALPNTSGSDVRDGIAYVVDRTGAPGTGLTRFDVSDPTSPVAVDTFTTGSQSFGIDLAGDVAFIANGFFQFISVDIAEPGDFSILDTFNPNSNTFDVQVRDDVAYVATFGGGLVTVDVADPAAMAQLSTNVVGGFLSSVTLDGDRAYLADGQVGLNVVDVSDPTMPQSLGTGAIAGIASGAAYSQGFAYIADEGFGLRQYDVTDPANPVETSAVISSDRMTDVDAQGDLVVAVDAGGGVYLFRARDNTPSGIASVDPEELSITVEEGDVETATLTLSNTGAGPLAYTVSVADADPASPAPSPAFASVRAGAEALAAFDGSDMPASQTGAASVASHHGGIVADPSFEAGRVTTFWTPTNPAYLGGNPIFGPLANPAAPPARTGDWYVILGSGTGNGPLSTGIEQDVTVTAGDYTLALWLLAGDNAGSTSEFYIEFDGEELFRIGLDEIVGSVYGEEYGLVEVPVTVAADGAYTLSFLQENDGTAPDPDFINFFIDDVSLTPAPPGLAVTVSPESGAVDADGSEELTVTVDASDLEPGVYAYEITISTDSFDTPMLTVPLTVEVLPTVANEGDAASTVFALEPAYPNPFAGSTTIRYALPEAARVTVEVYDAVGRRVAVLVDGEMPAGSHEAEWNAASMASGIYLYRMTADDFTKTLKVSLVR
jgi:hypothetical protein